MSAEKIVALTLCVSAIILTILLITIDYIKEELNKRK